MEIKLINLLNLITNKKSYKYIVIALLLSCFIIFGMVNEGRQKYIIPIFLACFVGLCVAVSCLFPSSIIVSDSEIKYTQLQYVRRVHGNNFSGSSINIGGNRIRFSFSYVEYTVTDIKTFNLSQTKLERALNTGHVEFCGKTRFYAKNDSEYISEKNIHIIYEIADFKKFKEMNEEKIESLIYAKHRFDMD